MPRVSKRQNLSAVGSTDIVEIKQWDKISKKTYRVAVYARLSADIDERKNESIDTQVSIIQDFIERKNIAYDEDMIIYDIYRDLGRTGTNFERDEFLRMMQDIRVGDVNCVIVKDLSRFGRNYLEAGNYIEKIFPFLGVRFIAIADNFDTNTAGSDNKSMTMKIKNLVNDMYAKDFSKKAKLSLKSRRERGEYVGGPAPYGYVTKVEDGKRTLAIDYVTEPIVKMIYDTFIKKQSYQGVTDLLNQKRINPPVVYKETKQAFCPENTVYRGWDKSSVERILSRVTYAGTLEQGKSNITLRSEANRVWLPKEQWVVKNNSHPPIIEQEVFDHAQRIINEIKEESAKHTTHTHLVPLQENIYDDVLYCGNCGRKMTRHSYVKQYCNGEVARIECFDCMRVYVSKYEQSCVSNRISKAILDDVVLGTLKNEFAIYLDKPVKFIELNQKNAEKYKKKTEQTRIKLMNRMEQMENQECELYERYRSGRLSQEEYVTIKLEQAEQYQSIQSEIEELDMKLNKLQKTVEKQNKVIKELLKVKPGKHFTKEFINTLFEKIYVYPGKRVELKLSLANDFMKGVDEL